MPTGYIPVCPNNKLLAPETTSYNSTKDKIRFLTRSPVVAKESRPFLGYGD